MTGKTISQGIIKIATPNLGTEILYSFLIIACSLLIYFGTKELYNLSNHKGIKYFRLAFLFFALAYFTRTFMKFFIEYLSIQRIIDISPNSTNFMVGQLTVFLSIYLSSMAVLFLLYSVMHKKWQNNKDQIYILHFLAIILALSIIITQSPLIYLAVNLILLLFIIFTFIISKSSQKKKKNSLHLIYALMIIFWLIHLLDILVPNFFRGFQLLIYLASLTIFLTILYKVLTKIGSN